MNLFSMFRHAIGETKPGSTGVLDSGFRRNGGAVAVGAIHGFRTHRMKAWACQCETGSLISITGGAKRPCGLRLYSSIQRSPLVMNSNGPVHLFSGFA